MISSYYYNGGSGFGYLNKLSWNIFHLLNSIKQFISNRTSTNPQTYTKQNKTKKQEKKRRNYKLGIDWEKRGSPLYNNIEAKCRRHKGTIMLEGDGW